MKRRPRRKRDCATGKVRYRGPGEAKHALRRLREGSIRDRIPHRVYECPACKGWHLSSHAG